MIVRALRYGRRRVLSRPESRRALRDARANGVAHGDPLNYRRLIHLLARDCHSVLDVGTGVMRSLAYLPCPVKLGLDAHRPYLEHREVAGPVPINGSALDLEGLFVPGAVDLVTMIDVIEHFPAADAHDVLRQAAAVAAKRVVLFTPRGHFPQEAHDAFGLGGEDFQQHRSSWEPEDLTALGFRVIILDAYHDASNASFVEAFGPDHPPVDALLAFRDAGPPRP